MSEVERSAYCRESELEQPCPYHAQPLATTPGETGVRHTFLPIVAGTLAIICSLLEGWIVLLVIISQSPYAEYTPIESALVRILFLTNVLGFAFGLTAGIQSIRRRHFRLIIVGICFLLTGSIVTTLEFPGVLYASDFFFQLGIISQILPLGILMLMFPVLSLILVNMSKGEFT